MAVDAQRRVRRRQRRTDPAAACRTTTGPGSAPARSWPSTWWSCADVWKNTSLVAFFLLAGLQTIPRELYEAARVDGAGPVSSFFRITLPLLVPTIAIVLVLRTIEAFKVFDIIYVMTGGGPAGGTQTITFLTYLQAFSAQRFSTGAALAYLTVIAILFLAVIYLRLLRQSEMRAHERQPRATGSSSMSPRSRRWR